MIQKKYFTKEQALQKAKHYCAYQERSHAEVKEKLYSFGLYKNDVEATLALLIEENYLNEERFAIAFAGGKFRIKQWGKVKIKYELKQKRVSDYCVKKALQQINDADYLKTLQQLFNAKLKTLKSEKNSINKKKKLQAHLMQKGFEINLISQLVNQSD
jgi:regulatory protein